MRKSSELHQWINTYLRGACITPQLRSDLFLNLKIAGFANGVPANKQSLARRIAGCTLREARKVEGSFRTAAVVSAGSACPRCGGTMTTVKLAGGEQAQYCQNTQCRVTAHIG